jgi:hypothetical protein
MIVRLQISFATRQGVPANFELGDRFDLGTMPVDGAVQRETLLWV